jgi:hypothetical protein
MGGMNTLDMAEACPADSTALIGLLFRAASTPVASASAEESWSSMIQSRSGLWPCQEVAEWLTFTSTPLIPCCAVSFE